MGEQTGSTVIEFVARHCAGHESVTEEALASHVNVIVLAATLRNRAVWKVGLDPDGRASLIWISCPDFVWEGLLVEGAQAQRLIDYFGGAE
jgi:hypothetical protein